MDASRIRELSVCCVTARSWTRRILLEAFLVVGETFGASKLGERAYSLCRHPCSLLRYPEYWRPFYEEDNTAVGRNVPASPACATSVALHAVRSQAAEAMLNDCPRAVPSFRRRDHTGLIRPVGQRQIFRCKLTMVSSTIFP